MGRGESKYQFKKRRSNNRYLSVSLFVLLFLIVGGAYAQQKSTTSVSEVPSKDDFKRLELELIGNFNTNLYSDKSLSKESSTDLWILPTFNFRNTSKLKIVSVLSRDISEEHKTKFSTTRVEYVSKSIDTKLAKITLAPATVLPTDYELYEQSTLRGALSFTASLTPKLPLEMLSITYAPRFTKNFHEYNTSATFGTNLEYTIRQRGTVAVSMTEKLGLNLLGDYVIGWTYRGTAKESFALAQEISYALTQRLTVALSHSNEGAAKKEGGAGSNLKVFNDHTSQISVGVDYVF